MLKPCPLCGGNKTEIQEQLYWTGMRYNVMSVNLRHWCESKEDIFGTGTFVLRARTAEQATEYWNTRHGIP